MPTRARGGLIQAARRHLMANHNCDHTIWKYRSGQNRCEECQDWLPRFIFECLQCRILMCRRCRYNRI